MDIDVANDTASVNDENRPLAIAFRTSHSIEVGDRRKRKVAQQWKTYASETFGPSLKTGDVVDTDAQHLGVQPFESSGIGLVGRDLIRSDRGPGKGEKSEYDIASTSKRAESNFTSQVTGKRKVRRFLSYL